MLETEVVIENITDIDMSEGLSGQILLLGRIEKCTGQTEWLIFYVSVALCADELKEHILFTAFFFFLLLAITKIRLKESKFISSLATVMAGFNCTIICKISNHNLYAFQNYAHAIARSLKHFFADPKSLKHVLFGQRHQRADVLQDTGVNHYVWLS